VTNPETIRILGWCLLHFVWQGAVLALTLSALLTCLRRPQARYGSAVGVLSLMMLAPVFTFAVLQRPDAVQPVAGSAIADIRSGLESVQSLAISASSRQIAPLAGPASSTDWLSCAVLVWLAGVYMFTLRTLGAWMLLMRLRRQRSEAIGGDLLRTCLALQERLGVARAVRYVCSKTVDSPAVLGWLRPVVVLPLSVLAGLTPWQLEAIIAHELAHIKRWDAFVNLFQVATETLLFYHPAVWWVNRVIRNEREHCCDDIAVEACGNAPGYARALALLEESRSAPILALTASGGVLTARISRLLGVNRATRSMSAPSIAMLAALSIAGALMAGSASTQAVGDVAQPPEPPRPVEAPLPFTPLAPLAQLTQLTQLTSNMAPTPAAPVSPVSPVHVPRLAALGETPPHRARESSRAESSSSAAGESYIGGLQAAGLKDLTVDRIIKLKIHGVTPEYIRGLRTAGVEATSDELVSLKIHDVTPEFVRELSEAGLSDLRIQDYLSARVQGITPEFIQKIRSHGFKDLTMRKLISLKIADIS
jgi:beta-lactamase regulating signal transducer with metallopeptidase domain